MNYIQLDCYCADEKTDHLIAFLADIGFEGFVETDHGFSAYIPETIFHTTGIEKEIEDLEELYDLEFGTKVVKEENWNKTWEAHFEPVKVNDKCGIRASFHEPFGLPYEIVIDPKMSFGTGHHETTMLMMQTMMDMDLKDKKILDYGCGTGILSILASKLGAKDIYAIDIDQWAFENTKENFELNGVENAVAAKGDEHHIPKEQYDIVLANINKHVILDTLCILHNRLKPGGKILASGFYYHDAADITEKAGQYQLTPNGKVIHNNWCCLSLNN